MSKLLKYDLYIVVHPASDDVKLMQLDGGLQETLEELLSRLRVIGSEIWHLLAENRVSPLSMRGWEPRPLERVFESRERLIGALLLRPKLRQHEMVVIGAQRPKALTEIINLSHRHKLSVRAHPAAFRLLVEPYQLEQETHNG